MNYSGYKDLQENGVYSVGTIKSKLHHKGIRKEIWFTFKTKNNKTQKSAHSPFILYKLFHDEKREVSEGDSFLVIYSQKNPQLNVLLLNRPITNNLNLDSLYNIRIDTKEIRFWDL